ncbi:MAG: single-stranded-DNA-specific exonuclease RecJ [Chlamydiia bacterium]
MSHTLTPGDPLWMFPKEDSALASRFEREFYLHPVVARILVARGLTTVEQVHQFLYAQLPDLTDPFLFSDMRLAVDRITRAIEAQEPILVFGDTDVDGMTGTALLVDFLSRVGGIVDFQLPNRQKLSGSVLPDACNLAQERGFRLLITVDCGITAREDEVHALKTAEVDLIITDHHEPTSRVQSCCAILNPKTVDSGYPNRHLTGVGVAFKLIHALTQHLLELKRLEPGTIDLKEYLDLVALGTVADMGALVGENRILVRYGLKQLNHTKRLGLRQLMEVSELHPGTLSSIDIVSKLAPRLNSLGRIADPRQGVELLITHDLEKATSLAKELERNNLQRQKIERAMSQELDKLLDAQPELLTRKAIAMSSTRWHPGVIPILSARLAKQYNRPTCLIAVEDQVGKGSIRTIPEFPLLPVLHEMRDLLVNYGGHDYAAGLVVEASRIEEVKQRFLDAAQKSLADDLLPFRLRLDAHVTLGDLTFDFMESLALLEPFGNENPSPVLFCEAQQQGARVIGKQHLRLYLGEEERCIEGIAFNMAEKRNLLSRKGERIRVAFTPTVVTQQCKAAIHLQVRDFKLLPAPPTVA